MKTKFSVLMIIFALLASTFNVMAATKPNSTTPKSKTSADNSIILASVPQHGKWTLIKIREKDLSKTYLNQVTSTFTTASSLYNKGR